MRSRTQTYSEMLRIQADMAFSLEMPFYQVPIWQSAMSVLDFGTGNGHYLRLLATKFPSKRYFGVETNLEMAEIAAARCGKRITVHAGEHTSIPSDWRFDFLIVRLVGLHLPDRSILQDVIKRHGAEHMGVLFIDADDAHFLFSREPKLFRAALETLRKKSINRDLRELIREEWRAAGFRQVLEQRVMINSDLPNNKERMYAYMRLTAEMSMGNPLEQSIAEELFDWLLDPESYVQYGIFGSVFER